jgi:hypothetical protein
MSLVGSLEDLGLGDILQIVHLSGKSGVLALRSDLGEGQIVFDKGLLRSARVRGLPQDLRELLSTRRAVAADALGDASREARRAGASLAAVLVERGLLTAEALEDLRGRSASDAVLEMFRWRAGQFSFEVRDFVAGEDDLELARPLNPQFLALEGARQNDEEGEAERPSEDSTDVIEAQPLEAGDDPFAEPAAGAFAPDERPDATATDVAAALEGPARETSSVAASDAPTAAGAPALGQPPPVIAIDPSLPALEWTKAALSGHARVHTFQHTELGIQRVRQYLLRHEPPIVLLAADTPPDPVSGARDVYDVATRLRRQAPRLPIVVTSVAGSRPPQRRRGVAVPTAYAERPKDGALADARRSAERLELAAALRTLVERLTQPGRPAAEAKAVVPASPPPSPDLARLREVSARFRERVRQGDVLSTVLAFAAETFSRVALFMVRDGSLVGIAQAGLAKAGGPDDAALGDVHLPARDSSWVRRALDTRAPVRGRPVDDGDHRLCVMLGNESPPEGYVAPIEGGGRVVAILYGDNLPGRELLPDTGALEVVLQEAARALDRSLKERSLAAGVGAGAAGA